MRRILILVTVAIVCFAGSPSWCSENLFIDLTGYQTVPAPGKGDSEIITVMLSGRINHFGIQDFHANVPGVNVHIAEFPASQDLMTISDDTGWWSMKIKKFRGVDIDISLVYEKKGWITTKSNVITIGDSDDTDLAIQFIDPDLFNKQMKPMTEVMLSMMAPTGDRPKFRNAVVATVGKSWASMHENRFPHGDPGATVTKIPGAAGPIYFDENVMPNPAYSKTSADGGVAWINVPEGERIVTAYKKGTKFSEVKFIVAPVEADGEIVLYIASPPDSIQGSDDSGPEKTN